MGREIRMVVPNWEHPKNEKGEYESMYDEDFPTAVKEWKKGYELWEKKEGEYSDIWKGDEYWEYEGTPDRERYRPVFAEKPTWFQMYETVSEGTPVTPPFATKAELVDYLVENGDFWDQSRGDGSWKRENAEKFVENGFAFSFVVDNGEIKSPRDGI